ncbi:alkaline phosphatase family protein [Actinophytocola sp.]|uniref:alkaline phosphatase family protein n=1 Tax=Actinophytocola sp. TaxID=1872138 RepID=UPI002ED679EE
MATPRRVVVVITEGATPELLTRWCDAGELPNFDRLFRSGRSGPLDADGVPYEPPGLVSLLTGRRPGDHGFYSYWSAHDHDHQPSVLGAERHRHPLLWQRSELNGLRFASVGIFGTHPPAPMPGSLITYPMRQTLRACYPPNLHRDLAERGIKPVHDVSIWWSGQPRSELLPRLLEADTRRGQATLALFDEGADITLVNLTAIDRCSHIFWQELELGPEREAGSAVLAAYRTADGVLGQFLDRLDDRTTLVAFSEIGFGPLRAYCSMNEVLERGGLLGRDEHGSTTWAKTSAFEAVQGTHGVNVNLRGRYRDGTVDPADYDRVRDDAAQALLDAVNPRTGLPYLAAVLRREEVYQGDALDEAPDLVLEPADWRYLPLGEPGWASHVHRHWQSAWHRPRSYWAAAGAGVRPGRASGPATPVDVAAAVVGYAGRDIPRDFAGTPLEALR